MSALTDRIFSLKRRGHNNFEIANITGLTPAQVVARLKDPSLADPSTGVGLLPEAPGGGGGGPTVQFYEGPLTLPDMVGSADYSEPSILLLGTLPLSPPRYQILLGAVAPSWSIVASDNSEDNRLDNIGGSVGVMVLPEGDDPLDSLVYSDGSGVQLSNGPSTSLKLRPIDTYDEDVQPIQSAWAAAAPDNNPRVLLPLAPGLTPNALPPQPPSSVDVYLVIPDGGEGYPTYTVSFPDGIEIYVG